MYLSRRQFLQVAASSILLPNTASATPQMSEKSMHIGQYAAVAFDVNTVLSNQIVPDLSNADLFRKASVYHDVDNELVWIKAAVGSSDQYKMELRGSKKIEELASIIVFCSSGKIMPQMPGKNRNNISVSVPDILHSTSFKTVQFNWIKNITRII